MNTYTITFKDNLAVSSSGEFYNTTVEPPEPADLESVVVLPEKGDKELSPGNAEVVVEEGVDGALDRIISSTGDESLIGKIIALKLPYEEGFVFYRCCGRFCPCPR